MSELQDLERSLLEQVRAAADVAALEGFCHSGGAENA